MLKLIYLPSNKVLNMNMFISFTLAVVTLIIECQIILKVSLPTLITPD